VTSFRVRRRNVGDAIFADEVGIEYGIIGDYRLRSAYQPIFEPRDGKLVPVAVEALVEPHLAGKPVAPSVFFERLAPQDRLYGETMCRVLHLRNFRNLGVNGLDLFFNYNPKINDVAKRALAQIRLMAMHLDEIELEPGMLVCEITEQAAPDEAVLVKLVREMRRNGIRVAVDDFGAGHSTAERMMMVEPDIVKLDGAWFAQLCRNAEAEKLFSPLVATLHARGVKVLVEGIETPHHLRIALEGGVDLLQGFHLARPALAGSFFDEGPLAIEPLAGAPAKVLPFHAIYQRR
jgi:EAL domain-containing protein (putative c-di-GMP-specific phosphodiesterase class I)